MAFRRPLVNNNGNMREMNDNEINLVRSRVRYLYMHNPSVRVDVVGSDGNLGTIYDSRYAAGADATNVSRFPTEAETAEPYLVYVGYSRLNQVVDVVSVGSDDGRRYPVYYDGSNVRSMSLQDMYDTFIFHGISSAYGDMYYVHSSSSLSGWSLQSSTPIFSDTGANTGLYTDGGIPEAQDQPYTRANFYLFRFYPGDPGAVNPLYTNSSNNIQEYSTSGFDSILTELARYVSVNVQGYRNRFSWGGEGISCGSAWDDRLNGSGNYVTSTVYNAGDDYRAQEFPDGSFVRVNTYFFRSRLV